MQNRNKTYMHNEYMLSLCLNTDCIMEGLLKDTRKVTLKEDLSNFFFFLIMGPNILTLTVYPHPSYLIVLLCLP